MREGGQRRINVRTEGGFLKQTDRFDLINDTAYDDLELRGLHGPETQSRCSNMDPPHVIKPIQSNKGSNNTRFTSQTRQLISGPAARVPCCTASTYYCTHFSSPAALHSCLLHHNHHGQITKQTYPRATLRPSETHLLSVSPLPHPSILSL